MNPVLLSAHDFHGETTHKEYSFYVPLIERKLEKIMLIDHLSIKFSSTRSLSEARD